MPASHAFADYLQGFETAAEWRRHPQPGPCLQTTYKDLKQRLPGAGVEVGPHCLQTTYKDLKLRYVFWHESPSMGLQTTYKDLKLDQPGGGRSHRRVCRLPTRI